MVVPATGGGVVQRDWNSLRAVWCGVQHRSVTPAADGYFAWLCQILSLKWLNVERAFRLISAPSPFWAGHAVFFCVRFVAAVFSGTLGQRVGSAVRKYGRGDDIPKLCPTCPCSRFAPLSLSLCLSRKNFDISKLIGRISRSDYCHSFRPLLLTCSLAVAVPILEWGLIYVYRFQLKFMSPSDLIPKISPHKTATDATRLSLRRRPGGWWSRNINRVYYVWRAGSSRSRALCGQRRYRVCMANRFKW